MIQVSKKRLEYAAEVFLSSIRAAAYNGGSSVVIKNLGQYPPEHRSALMDAVGKAIASTQPENDNGFQNWSNRNAG